MQSTVQVNETDMQERRQKLLNLNKIRGFDESHPISVSGDARYNNRLDNLLPMVTPLQALDLKGVNKHTVPYTLKT